MFTSERTGQEILPAPDAANLKIGRKEGEGLVFTLGGLQVVVFVQGIRGGRCDLKISAPKLVVVDRLKGNIEGY